jgi:hypothetical protein
MRRTRNTGKFSICLVSVLSLLSVVTNSVGKPQRDSGAAETKWKKYENARFGFVLPYPASLIGSRQAENGDGREFHTRDREFSVAGVAHFFVPDTGDSFEARWKEELETPDVTITSKKKTDTEYTVSGVTKDGTEYFHKMFVQGKNWASFHITFPHAKRQKYADWVSRIEKDFIPFREGDYDRLD